MVRIRIVFLALMLFSITKSFGQYSRGLDNAQEINNGRHMWQGSGHVGSPTDSWRSDYLYYGYRDPEVWDYAVFLYNGTYILPSSTKYAYYGISLVSVFPGCHDGLSVWSDAPINSFKSFTLYKTPPSDCGTMVGCEPKVSTHISAALNDGYVGKFKMWGSMVYRDLYGWNGCQDNGSAFTVGDFNYCRLAAPNTPVGKMGIKGVLNKTTQADLDGNNNTYSILSDDGQVNFDFVWINTEDYCHEMLETIEYRIIKSTYKNSAGVNVVEDTPNAQWLGLFAETGNTTTYLGKTAISCYTSLSKYGTYEYEFRMKNRNITTMTMNGNFTGFNFYYSGWNHIVVNVEPSCKTAADPTPTLAGEGGAAVVTIEGGYSPTPKSANAIEGGYQITKGASYNLDLDGNNTIGKTVASTFVRQFDTYYNVNYSPTNEPFGLDLQYNPDNGRYKISASQDLASYTFTVSKKSFLGGLCKEYQPLNIFVGGGNIDVFRRCLVNIPDDLMDLFPGLVEKFGHKIVLRRFTFKIRSQQGIIIRPNSFNTAIAQTDEVVLADGAQLIAETTPVTPDPELVDNTKNWTQSTVYNENGAVIAEQKQFLDSKGQPTQLQWKNLSAGVVLASENVYDAYGRLGIKTLPAPVSSKTTYANDVCGEKINRGKDLYFTYFSAFITKNGSPYDANYWDDFSLKNGSNAPLAYSKKFNPDPISDYPIFDSQQNKLLGNLGLYYSNSNSNSDPLMKEPQVASTSYPYSRILYHEDGSNRVLGATLPGLPPSSSKYFTQSDRSELTTADKTIVSAYLSTLKTDVLNGTIPAADLNTTVYKEIIIDSEGKETNIFKDIDDNVIITKHVPSGDLSYNFYNAKGQLVASMTPLGVKQIRDEGVSYADAMKTKFTYNHRGQLISKEDPDEGVIDYMYADDGKLRFTQNAKQARVNKFNYVNYDRVGRPIESGEFKATGSDATTKLLFNTAPLKALLNLSAANYTLSSGGDKTEVIKTTYDIEGPVSVALSGKTQEFLMGAVSYTEREGGKTKTWYSYDDRGRVVWMATYNDALYVASDPLSGTKVVEYSYTASGQVKQVAYQPGAAEAFYHGYGYDFDNRLVEVRTSTTPITFDINTEKPTSGKVRSTYEYYLHGPLKKTTLGDPSDGNSATQKMDFRYTAQGWLKAINNPFNDAPTNLDIFSMALDYYAGDYTKTGQYVPTSSLDATFPVAFKTEYHNGIVKSSLFKAVKPATFTPVGREAFAYSYDSKYQLLGTRYGSNFNANQFILSNKMHENFTYDANGNLQTLTRLNATTGANLHNFTYTYDPTSKLKNRLTEITGYATNYSYTSIGEVSARTTPAYGDEIYTYDSRGLVSDIDIVPVTGTTSEIDMEYDESGNRVEKRATQGTAVNSTVYVRGLGGKVMAIYQGTGATPVYSISEIPIYGATRLGSVNNVGEATFEITDHLGNVRATFLEHKVAGVLTISDYAEYYAHGLEIPGRNQIGSPAYRNGYQGQFSEKDGETGLSYFQLRMWDRMGGRWLTTDPYGQFQSPYVGMGNNPIMGVDPDGGFFRYKGGTRAQRQQLRENFREARRNSATFRKDFNKLRFSLVMHTIEVVDDYSNGQDKHLQNRDGVPGGVLGEYINITWGTKTNAAFVIPEGKGSHMFINVSRINREHGNFAARGLMNQQIHEFKHMYTNHTGTTPSRKPNSFGVSQNEAGATDYQKIIINEMNKSLGTQKYFMRNSYND